MLNRFCLYIAVVFAVSAFTWLNSAKGSTELDSVVKETSNPATVEEKRRIWGVELIPDREEDRQELTDLLLFDGYWYSAFREGEVHYNHPSGRVRVIRSSDPLEGDWDTVALMEWEGGDVRDPDFSVTAEGQLMLTACIWFVSKAESLGVERTPRSGSEEDVVRQSVSWLSRDGKTWSSVHLDPSGVNTWRWSTTWHNGMGYSISYAGKDESGCLYRTRDGKNWRLLADDIFPPAGTGTEASLSFTNDIAYCLLRHHTDPYTTKLGVSNYPYTEWEWEDLEIAPLGGPKLFSLSDGRMVAAGRLEGTVTLFMVDLEEKRLNKFAQADGTSYPGVVEHNGFLWVTYEGFARDGIYLGKVNIPAE